MKPQPWTMKQQRKWYKVKIINIRMVFSKFTVLVSNSEDNLFLKFNLKFSNVFIKSVIELTIDPDELELNNDRTDEV